MVLFKETKKLFFDEFPYKIVLRTKYARWFRNEQDLEVIKNRIWSNINDVHVEYVRNVLGELETIDKFKFRVETPFLSIYLNNEDALNSILNIDTSMVKYYSKPLTNLIAGEVVVKSLPYGFKVFLDRTTQSHASFVEWAEAQPTKFRLPKSCKTQLCKQRNFRSIYFYAKDENSILLARMQLGSAIKSIEKIVKG